MAKMKYAAYIFGLVFLWACQRNPISPNPTQAPCKLTKVLYLDPFNDPNWRREYTMIYNGDKIAEAKSNVDRFVFSYDALGNLISKEMYLIGDLAVKYRINYTFDNQSRLIKKKKYVEGMTFYNSTQDYFYTNEEMTETKLYGSSGDYLGKEIRTWSNGNSITRAGYNASGYLEYSVNNVYDTSKKNKLISEHKNFFQIYLEDQYYDEPYGLELFLCENLLIKSVYLTPSQATDNYYYSFNNKGFIKEILYSDGAVQPLLFMTFTYSCD